MNTKNKTQKIIMCLYTFFLILAMLPVPIMATENRESLHTDVYAGSYVATKREMTLYVLGSDNVPLSNAIVKFRHEIPGASSFVLLGVTDSTGKLKASFEINETYSFYTVKAGYYDSQTSKLIEDTPGSSDIILIVLTKKPGESSSSSSSSSTNRGSTVYVPSASSTVYIPIVFPPQPAASASTTTRRRAAAATTKEADEGISEEEKEADDTIDWDAIVPAEKPSESENSLVQPTVEPQPPAKKRIWPIVLIIVFAVLAACGLAAMLLWYFWLRFKPAAYLHIMDDSDTEEFTYPILRTRNNQFKYLFKNEQAAKNRNILLDYRNHANFSDDNNLLFAYERSELFKDYADKAYAEANPNMYIEQSGSKKRILLSSCTMLERMKQNATAETIDVLENKLKAADVYYRLFTPSSEDKLVTIVTNDINDSAKRMVLQFAIKNT